MAYFLGRDVDVFITTEGGFDVEVGVSGGKCITGASGTSYSEGIFAGSYSGAGTISGAKVTDLTGVDLSISASDTDVGPFYGQRSTNTLELRKEHTVSLTKKKDDIVWDVIFNGPTATGSFSGSGKAASGQGARWGLVCSGGATTAASMNIGDGNYNMADTNTVGANPTMSGSHCVAGYRVFVRMKDGEETYIVRNASVSAHTVSLNADGTTEETLELKTTVPALMATTSALSAPLTPTGATPVTEM